MDDDVKATPPEHPVEDANQADPPKVEENVQNFGQLPAVSLMEPIGSKVPPESVVRPLTALHPDEQIAASQEDVETATEPVEAEVPLKFKIKVQGIEKDVTLTKDELIKRIQLSEDYHLKTAQLAEDKRKVFPYVHVIQTQAFQELCEEMSSAEPVGIVTEKELVQRMRRGDTAAAALLILRRGKERI